MLCAKSIAEAERHIEEFGAFATACLAEASMARQMLKSESPSPWEVVAFYVCALESRVAALEAQLAAK